MTALRYNIRSALCLGMALAGSPASALAPPAPPPSTRASAHRADKKDPTAASAAPSYFATLAWVHGDTRVVVSPASPSPERFDRLVADRISGEVHPLDPRLLELLKTIAAHYPAARIELVSGFRSPKMNEMLRKKGHKVAQQSQHSEGHAVDFRIIPDGAREPLDPFDVEVWLRSELHWDGGIGVYPSKPDRFVHADVGKNRRWISR